MKYRGTLLMKVIQDKSSFHIQCRRGLHWPSVRSYGLRGRKSSGLTGLLDRSDRSAD